MRIHCDGCGVELEQAKAIVKSVDGERFFFCSDACARAGRHLADEPYAEDDAPGAGPVTPGDLDEPPRPERRKR